jgi:pilus assembly protein TadC
MIDLGIVAAIGGVLLAIAIVYAIIRNRQRTYADRRRTEEATKDLYARVDRQDQVSDPDTANY